MKTKDDCFLLGHVSKTVGYKGQISIKIDADNPYLYAKLKAFYLDINQQLVPFFIQEFKINDRGFAKATIEGMTTQDSANLATGKDVYLPIEESYFV